MKGWKKRLLFVGIVIVLLILILIAVYLMMNARSFQLFGKLINRVETDEKVVFLTFDDGPTENTPRVLNTLDALDVKATFFLIGKSMEEHKAFAQQIIEAGHAVGNHSYTHTRLVFRPLSDIKEEVNKTNEIIRSFGYDKEIFFRPPNGKKLLLLPWYLKETGQTTVMWTLEPDSYSDVNQDADSMAQYVIDNVSNGAIILLHPMNDKTDKTLDAVEIIVTELRDRGYRFATLPEGLSE